MENTVDQTKASERKVNLIIGIVVIVAVIIMVAMEVSKVNHDNSISRKGNLETTK